MLRCHDVLESSVSRPMPGVEGPLVSCCSLALITTFLEMFLSLQVRDVCGSELQEEHYGVFQRYKLLNQELSTAAIRMGITNTAYS